MSMSRARYRVTRVVAWSAWSAAFAGTLCRATETIPARMSIFVVLAIGIGVAASLALSRHKLAETISEVFVVGMKISMMKHLTAEQRLQALDDFAQTLPGEPGVEPEE